jgi:hypothetical protein
MQAQKLIEQACVINSVKLMEKAIRLGANPKRHEFQLYFLSLREKSYDVAKFLFNLGDDKDFIDYSSNYPYASIYVTLQRGDEELMFMTIGRFGAKVIHQALVDGSP